MAESTVRIEQLIDALLSLNVAYPTMVAHPPLQQRQLPKLRHMPLLMLCLPDCQVQYSNSSMRRSAVNWSLGVQAVFAADVGQRLVPLHLRMPVAVLTGFVEWPRHLAPHQVPG